MDYNGPTLAKQCTVLDLRRWLEHPHVEGLRKLIDGPDMDAALIQLIEQARAATTPGGMEWTLGRMAGLLFLAERLARGAGKDESEAERDQWIMVAALLLAQAPEGLQENILLDLPAMTFQLHPDLEAVFLDKEKTDGHA